MSTALPKSHTSVRRGVSERCWPDSSHGLARDGGQTSNICSIVALRRVHDDGGARFGISEGIVVIEVFEACRHRRHRQSVGVEIIGATGHEKATHVAEVWAVHETCGARGRDDTHIESSVVSNEGVARGEGDQIRKLLAPKRRIVDIRSHDAVNTRVPFVERVVADRRMNEPPGLLDDFAVAHFDHADRARGGAIGVGCFEIDGGEVEAHNRIVPLTPDVSLRHAPVWSRTPQI